MIASLKQEAKILIPRVLVPEVRTKAQAFNQQDALMLINGSKAILHYKLVESDPIWLLDLRRAGIPYVWFWGASALNWSYVDASLIKRGRGHVVFQTGPATKTNSAYFTASNDFNNFEFTHELESAELLHNDPVSEYLLA